MSLNADIILKKYEHKPLDWKSLEDYQKWALTLFHDPQRSGDPNLSFTIQLDVTEARKVYVDYKQNFQCGSFTAYLVWGLAKAIYASPDLKLRHLGDQWYELADPPLYFPVAIGGSKRFGTIFIENPGSSTWESFAKEYSRQLHLAKAGSTEITVSPEEFYTANFMGKLQNLRFTAFSFQQFPYQTGRQLYYFGERYEQDGQLFVPLSVTLDHANADPFIFNDVLNDFAKVLVNKI